MFVGMMIATVIGFLCGITAERIVQRKKAFLAAKAEEKEMHDQYSMRTYMMRDIEMTEALYDEKYGRL